MLERTSTPIFSTLTSQELADWIKIDADTDDNVTDILLVSATEVVEGLTGVILCQANYRVTEFGFCGSYLRLNATPVQSITAVNVTLAGQTTTTTDFTFLPGSNPALLFNTPIEADIITVDFVGGYAHYTDIPVALRQAVAVLVSAGYNNRESLDPQTLATVTNLVSRWRRFF